MDVRTQNIFAAEGQFSLRTRASAGENERLSLVLVRDDDLWPDPVELSTLSFDMLVQSGGVDSTGYRWELQLEVRRSDRTDPHEIHYMVGAPDGIAAPGGFIPPASSDIFLSGSPTEDTWLHFERDLAADLVVSGTPSGVSDPGNFFVERVIIRFIVSSGSKTIYLDDLRIGRLVVETPRSLMEDAISRLEEVRNDIYGGASGVDDPKDAVEEIDEAVEHVGEGFARELWATASADIDPERLDPEEGDEVIEEVRHAIQDILDAINEGDITNPDMMNELLSVVDKLVKAGHLLAKVAIDDAEADPHADQEKVDKAKERLSEGDQLAEDAVVEVDLNRKEELFRKAIQNYGEAWKAVIKDIDDL